MTGISSPSQVKISSRSFAVCLSWQLIGRRKIVVISCWRFWFKNQTSIVSTRAINRIITQITTRNKICTLRSAPSMKKSSERRCFIFCFAVFILIIIIGNGRLFWNFELQSFGLISWTDIESISIACISNLPTRVILRGHIRILIFRFQHQTTSRLTIAFLFFLTGGSIRIIRNVGHHLLRITRRLNLFVVVNVFNA